MDAWDVAALSRATGSGDGSDEGGSSPLEEQSDAYDALVSAALEADGCAPQLSTYELGDPNPHPHPHPNPSPNPNPYPNPNQVRAGAGHLRARGRLRPPHLLLPPHRPQPGRHAIPTELSIYAPNPDPNPNTLLAPPPSPPPPSGTPRVILGVTYFADGAVARCDVNFATLTRGQRSMVIVPPWQCSSSAPAPPQGAPGGSGQLGTPRKRPARWAPSHRLGCSS